MKLKLELLELLRSWAPLRMNGKQPAHESEYCNLDVQSGAKLSFLQEVAVMINTGVVNPNLSMQDRRAPFLGTPDQVVALPYVDKQLLISNLLMSSVSAIKLKIASLGCRAFVPRVRNSSQ